MVGEIKIKQGVKMKISDKEGWWKIEREGTLKNGRCVLCSKYRTRRKGRVKNADGQFVQGNPYH